MEWEEGQLSTLEADVEAKDLTNDDNESNLDNGYLSKIVNLDLHVGRDQLSGSDWIGTQRLDEKNGNKVVVCSSMCLKRQWRQAVNSTFGFEPFVTVNDNS